MKIGNFLINPVSILLFIAAGGMQTAFVGQTWSHIGTTLALICGMLAQSMTTQNAPATTVQRGALMVDPSGKTNGDRVSSESTTTGEKHVTPNALG
jgi:hypothetical protein